LLVGVSGSIAAVSIHHYLTMLRAAYAREVVVVLSYSAEKFVSSTALAYFCDELVLASQPGGKSHAQLASWADEYLILPATAHIVAELAHGLAGSFLSGIALAFDGPVTVCPSMNRSMWAKKAVQRNMSQVEQDGYHICEPVENYAYQAALGEVHRDLGLRPPNGLVHYLRGRFDQNAELRSEGQRNSG
jgi:phosphopantothenoylcysteine synthetase/decarboxylase